MWKLQEFDGQFTLIKRNMPNNVFWNKVIKHYKSSIPIILIGFYLLANQRFITKNWTPYIFVTVVSAVWGGYWPAILVETTQLCRCLLCFFKKRAAVGNELTVTLRRFCSFPCASFVKNFMSITSKERSFYFQAIYLTYIKFTNVVISWDHELNL